MMQEDLKCGQSLSWLYLQIEHLFWKTMLPLTFKLNLEITDHPVTLLDLSEFDARKQINDLQENLIFPNSILLQIN